MRTGLKAPGVGCRQNPRHISFGSESPRAVSSRTNLARGGVTVEGGLGNGHFRVLCNKGAGGAGLELKRPVAGRTGDGLCFRRAASHSQAWGDGQSASMMGKCTLCLGESKPFRPRASAFQLGTYTRSLVNQGAGQAALEDGSEDGSGGGSGALARALHQSGGLGRTVEHDVVGKVEWADCGAESPASRRRVARAFQALWARPASLCLKGDEADGTFLACPHTLEPGDSCSQVECSQGNQLAPPKI